MRIYIDIETAPAAHWTNTQIADHARDLVPKTHKRPDTIAAWLAENGPGTFAGTATEYRLGWISCIGVLAEDGEAPTIIRGVSPLDQGEVALATSEARALRELGELIAKTKAAILGGPPISPGGDVSRGGLWAPQFVTWNGDSFDMPWLHRAALKYRLGALARELRGDLALSPSRPGGRWVDLMRSWNYGNPREYAKQSDVARYLGVAQPNPIDGSQVPGLWLDGRPDVIYQHCAADLVELREIDRVLRGQ